MNDPPDKSLIRILNPSSDPHIVMPSFLKRLAEDDDPQVHSRKRACTQLVRLVVGMVPYVPWFPVCRHHYLCK